MGTPGRRVRNQNELAHQRFLDADAALGKRIADLVSGMGAFIARLEEKS